MNWVAEDLRHWLVFLYSFRVTLRYILVFEFCSLVKSSFTNAFVNDKGRRKAQNLIETNEAVLLNNEWHINDESVRAVSLHV